MDQPKYRDYRILARDGKRYRPVSDILPNGKVIWAASTADELRWFQLDQAGLAKRKARLYKRFSDVKFSIRKV